MLTNATAGDTAWILISAALVFLMVPGFAFFYGGIFRKNNSLTLLSLSFTLLCLLTLQWVFVGYSLAFGPDHNGWIGSLTWAGLRNVGAEPNLEYAGTVPHMAFMMYRGMIAVLAPILFLSPFAERVKKSALCLMALLWTTLVSDPVMHWVWGVGGFLRISGAFDFAGGITIFVIAALAALALSLVLKKSDEPSHAAQHSPEFVWLGAVILWFGSFGLITGNALATPALAANAFMMTQIAAATAAILWLLLDKLLNQELSPFGILMGALVGVVAMSPTASFVNLGGALAIGAGAALFSYASLAFLRKRLGRHDVFFTLSLFGVSGFWGMIASGLWSMKSENSIGKDGLFYGNPAQFMIQLRATLSITIYSFGMSYLLFKILHYIFDLKKSEHPDAS